MRRQNFILVALVLAGSIIFFQTQIADAAPTTLVSSSDQTPVRGEHRVFYEESSPGRSNLSVLLLRRGRNYWLRMQEQRVRGATRMRTELREGCTVVPPTASTRFPEGEDPSPVISPRPFYCMLKARNTTSGGIQSRYVLQADLGDRDDVLVASQLPSGVVLVATGGHGADQIKGGSGADGICAGSLSNANDSRNPGYITGCQTSDSQSTRPSQDVIFGGAGNDKIQGDSSINALHGGPGDDKLNGQGAGDLLIGDEGDDNLEGGEGDDTLETNWFESSPGAQQRMWTQGADNIDGGPGTDRLGYNHHTEPVTANGNTVIPHGGQSDRYQGIEELDLSKAADVFSSGPRASLVVHGLAGDDQINVSGDPSAEFNQRVFCGSGNDNVSIDVNSIPDEDGRNQTSGGIEIMKDGSTDCEHVGYRAAR